MNKELLKEKISDSGLKLAAIAIKVGISRESLYNKLEGKSEFKLSEFSTISEILSLTEAEQRQIFFD